MSLYTGFAVSLNHKLHGNMFCMQYKTSWYKTSWGRASQPVTSHSCSPARCMISGFKAMPRSNDFSSALPPPPAPPPTRRSPTYRACHEYPAVSNPD